MSKPKWIDDYGEIVRLAHWLVKWEGWEHLDASDKEAELLNFLSKPWNYDNEYKVMTGDAFVCAGCEAIADVECEDQADRVADGRACYCSECATEALLDRRAMAEDAQVEEYLERRRL